MTLYDLLAPLFIVGLYLGTLAVCSLAGTVLGALLSRLLKD